MNKIFFGDYSIEFIEQTKDKEEQLEKLYYGNSYIIPMKKNTQFKIKISNSTENRTDVKIMFTGFPNNTYRVNPKSVITINGLSSENIDDSIKIIFMTENESTHKILSPYYIPKPNNGNKNNCFNNYTDGVTPYNKTNRRCIVDANDYEANWRQMFGLSVDQYYGLNTNMHDYIKKLPLKNYTTSQLAIKILVNDDKKFYNKSNVMYNKYNKCNTKTNIVTTRHYETSKLGPDESGNHIEGSDKSGNPIEGPNDYHTHEYDTVFDYL